MLSSHAGKGVEMEVLDLIKLVCEISSAIIACVCYFEEEYAQAAYFIAFAVWLAV